MEHFYRCDICKKIFSNKDVAEKHEAECKLKEEAKQQKREIQSKRLKEITDMNKTLQQKVKDYKKDYPTSNLPLLEDLTSFLWWQL